MQYLEGREGEDVGLLCIQLDRHVLFMLQQRQLLLLVAPHSYLGSSACLRITLTGLRKCTHQSAATMAA